MARISIRPFAHSILYRLDASHIGRVFLKGFSTAHLPWTLGRPPLNVGERACDNSRTIAMGQHLFRLIFLSIPLSLSFFRSLSFSFYSYIFSFSFFLFLYFFISIPLSPVFLSFFLSIPLFLSFYSYTSFFLFLYLFFSLGHFSIYSSISSTFFSLLPTPLSVFSFSYLLLPISLSFFCSLSLFLFLSHLLCSSFRSLFPT